MKSIEECARKDIVFLALYPHVIMRTLQQIKDVVTEQTILISLTAKITIEQISSVVKCQQIVRILSTAISFINQGYNPVTFKQTMSGFQKWSVLEMLNFLGHAFETSQEKLEGYAVISSMLPTYFWFQWHEVEMIGTQFGLSLSECRESVYETMYGAPNAMYRSGMEPKDLMDLIPSKPLSENEEQIKAIYKEKLNETYHKIKPSK
jgi:pyrroline-5-carboxylate reductase